MVAVVVEVSADEAMTVVGREIMLAGEFAICIMLTPGFCSGADRVSHTSYDCVLSLIRQVGFSNQCSEW